jgi:hypothetical protein
VTAKNRPRKTDGEEETMDQRNVGEEVMGREAWRRSDGRELDRATKSARRGDIDIDFFSFC